MNTTELREILKMKGVTLTGDKCQCPACGEVFFSISAFDQHRKHGACLTPVEMEASGMTKHGEFYVTRNNVYAEHRDSVDAC